MRKNAAIASTDRIPLLQKLAFSCGINMEFVATGLMTNVLWMPFFNIGLGINAVVLGGILVVLRIWDAVTDPIMGNISDNTRTRWGRRRPYMFVGAIATACLYPLFWYFPDFQEQSGQVIYLLCVGLGFFTCYTLWSMPYFGLQLEMTPSYDERTRLTAWMTFFGKISALIGGWLLSFVMLMGMLAQNDPTVFEGRSEIVHRLLSLLQPFVAGIAGAGEGERPIVVGMRFTCWIIAIGIVVFGLLPALFVKERYYQSDNFKQVKEPFWKSVRESAGCKPMWSLISVSFFLVLGGSSVGALGQYVNFYYACGGDLVLGAYIAGLKGTVVVIAGISTIPLFTWLGEKLDKRTVVIIMLSSSMFGHLLNLFLMTPHNPYLQIIPGVFESSAISAIWLFLPSMKADVADWDEQVTLRRREGSLNAFYSWFIKVSLTASMGIGGVVLQLSGFDPLLEVQPDAVTTKMFNIYLVLPVVIWIAAVASACFYPLTREKCMQIRDVLEKRRGAF